MSNNCGMMESQTDKFGQELDAIFVNNSYRTCAMLGRGV